MTLKALQKNIKTKENKNQEQKRQYNLNTYITSKNHHLVVLDNTLYPTAPISVSTILLDHPPPILVLETYVRPPLSAEIE
jgi:hemerythrin-like domain-containing protein